MVGGVGVLIEGEAAGSREGGVKDSRAAIGSSSSSNTLNKSPTDTRELICLPLIHTHLLLFTTFKEQNERERERTKKPKRLVKPFDIDQPTKHQSLKENTGF